MEKARLMMYSIETGGEIGLEDQAEEAGTEEQLIKERGTLPGFAGTEALAKTSQGLLLEFPVYVN